MDYPLELKYPINKNRFISKAMSSPAQFKETFSKDQMDLSLTLDFYYREKTLKKLKNIR